MSRGLFNEVLIIEVSKRPLLWDVKDNNFRNKSTKESLWEEVRDAIRAIDDTVTVEEIIARWKNLKDTYRREIKDEKDGKKSGSGATAKTAWPHLKQMEFLRDSMETRRFRHVTTRHQCSELRSEAGAGLEHRTGRDDFLPIIVPHWRRIS
ncbi:hypothetical protein V5799_022788 [Amblyomma americanum]|uniref:MADF domain-containing protein n=1 Tax=Amblyomma americanum TaxID=6943 RepID=A0AAQ4FJI7_AMBAM